MFSSFNMFRQTLAHIKLLSYVSPDPPRAERAMFDCITCSLKLCKRVLTRELLRTLVKCGVGTNDVENVCKSNVGGKKRDVSMIKFIMSRKLRDANIEEKRVRREYGKKSMEVNKVIPKGSDVDIRFRVTMRYETEKMWEKRKDKNRRKVCSLTKKYKPKEHMEEEIRNIFYRDTELENMERNGRSRSIGNINEPRLYGGVVVSADAVSILGKDPNFMILDQISKEEIEVEIEKGLAKARYELMDCDNGGIGEGEGTKEIHNNTLNYASLRATDIPTVARLYPPKPSTITKEKILDNVKNKLLETVSEYQRQYCDDKGRIKNRNVTEGEEKAIKDLKKRIVDKEIVVSTTDKSGRFTVDTPSNYEEAVMRHTVNDNEVERERVRQVENRVNQHMKQFNKMFNVGRDHEHERRVEMATRSTNTPAPPMYGLRKDHKVSEDATKGPPVRPVCGANQAPNSRLGNFLSRIVNDFADAAEMTTECRSSEEMRAEFERYNDTEPSARRDCAVISMDVKALYPSMEWKEIVTSVKELIESSDKEVENVDYWEIGKYLAVTMPREEIAREGLTNVIPDRIEETGREISVAYLCNNNNVDKWKKARKPGNKQKKKMVALAVAEGVKACMSHHVYCVGDKTFLQQDGGPIGLELTGAVSRSFMWRWDKLYLEKVKKAKINMMLYERYVDDSNQVAVVPPPGSKYNEERGKLVMDPQLRDHDVPADERLTRILLSIANSVMECVKMEADWPSRNSDKKMPILDMKVWTDDTGTLLYQHYEKDVSSKTVLNAKSAHSAACKRGVHTQEVVRRLLNSSHRLDWERDTAPVVTEYMKRMKVAGYGERYRKEVLKHALSIYDKKWEDNKNGIRPIFRPKTWKKEERKDAKEVKKRSWATKGGHIAPIFVPTTPGGTLLKMMRQVAEEEAKEGIRFKVMEVGGKTVKRTLQRSNPTATPGCEDEDCIACKDERGKGGNCRRNNVNYEIECQLCPEGSRPVYIGETSRNLYTRAKEHMGSENREGTGDNESCFVRNHMQQHHQGMESKFRAKVTKTNKDSFSRQIREGVLIRRSDREMLNSKSEWFQPPIFRVRSEIVRE